MFLQESYRAQTPPTSHPLSSSHRDVTYSCGSCGFPLNLSSSNRNTSNIGSKYRKAIKKGVVSFFSIDESRFSQADELLCLPCFNSKHSWGLFGRRTRLLCRKCGNFIGSVSPIGPNSCRKYNIKISALQPSSAEGSAIPLLGA